MGEEPTPAPRVLGGLVTVDSPKPSVGLMERHRAAMDIVQTLSQEERYDLLFAVVWPSDERLQDKEAA